MKTYTYDETLALLGSVIAKKGQDFVYESGPEGRPGPSCHYAYDGQPDCLIGHVFAEVGVPVSDMEYGDAGVYLGELPANRGKYSMESAADVIHNLARDGVVDFTPKARRLLGEAQNAQDYGTPWGEALEKGIAQSFGLNEDTYWND